MNKPTQSPIPYPLSPISVPRRKYPGTLQIIMDGNGRWAQQKGLPRIEGHRQVRIACVELQKSAAGWVSSISRYIVFPVKIGSGPPMRSIFLWNCCKST